MLYQDKHLGPDMRYRRFYLRCWQHILNKFIGRDRVQKCQKSQAIEFYGQGDHYLHPCFCSSENANDHCLSWYLSLLIETSNTYIYIHVYIDLQVHV